VGHCHRRRCRRVVAGLTAHCRKLDCQQGVARVVHSSHVCFVLNLIEKCAGDKDRRFGDVHALASAPRDDG
jgi:hypothetical protein